MTLHDKINPVCSWLARMGRRICAIDVRGFQLPLGLLSLGWAFVLADPEHLSNSVYGVFTMAAPHWVWCVTMAAIGGAQLAGFFANSRRVSRMALYGSTSIWTFVACLFLLQSNAPTGFISYGIFAIMSAWALTKSGNGAG